ncbi:EAL domain-containing protein [Methyloversatilis thermotolerans]|uniref:EAL domain-containing protein n=1 Tax=Methyloversatilis thermotolerans TaxID=1346290 RepID=UPI00058F37F1|nr:EAL domain-containing protein [Methyloversatilis thermotolerans]
MRRRALTWLLTAAALVAGLLPVVAALYFSWVYTLRVETLHLDALAQHALNRAEQVFDDAEVGLDLLQDHHGQVCSEEHVQALRDINYRTPFVREIAYVDNGEILCTSMGDGFQRRLPAPDWADSQGRQIWFRVTHALDDKKPSVGVGRGHYLALIHASHFETRAVGDTRLAVLSTTDWLPLAPIDELLLPSMIDTAVTGRERIQGDRLYAVVQSRHLPMVVVGAQTRAQLLAAWTEPLVMMTALGILVSALLVWAVRRFSRDYFSPASALLSAIRRGELRVAYHPQIRLSDGRCVGAELLVRWPDQNDPVMTTDDLVHLAEHSGFEHEITARVLRNAISEIGDLLQRRPELTVSLNLASLDLERGDLSELLNEVVDASGIRRSQIELELTERTLIQAGAAADALARLREAGHKVLLDDFGTGYSSLSYLHDLPVDALKIDRAFVGTIGADTPHAPLIPHIAEIARARSLQMVAEGVETEQQARYLREQGVEIAQGYLYARPMDAGEFRHFLATRS